ncbi:DUF2157 domain-containing protein [Flavobacterium psychrolimnae]|uniref:DUF2157 domain-containing protein n=1 Tax=Flavobacterium psychrolimnae TaxID=249351 RepID=A0A366B3T7_9FLAO|nr:DUF2157 domain-containing protein [Flavobacterium psychrolimnae]RBN51765.1 hypothetical protein DR980_00955 [Flavobacterium psychrolimnae]
MSDKITNELEELLQANVVTTETAEKIREYFHQKKEENHNRLSSIFGILGAILVGLGIILVFAHNWDNLSRLIKIILSFLPLLIGQLLCGYSILKKSESTVWKETSSVFLFFAIGASISLVAQVYNIPGDINSFIISWMLLSLPLVYLLQSSIVSLLYIAGITYYGCNANYFTYPSTHSFLYWLLLLGIAPHYYQLIKTKALSNFTLFHNWFIAVSIVICLGTIAHKNGHLMHFSYMSLFTIFYFIGKTQFFDQQKLKNNSFLIIGKLGILYLLLLYSFKWFWDKSFYKTDSISETLLSIEFITAFVLTLIAAFFFYKKNNQTNFKEIYLLELVFLMNIFPLISGYEFSIVANAIVLFIGIFDVKRGIKLNHLGILNFGLLLITILITCRFFDTDLSFVIRGILFITIGLGFFLANYFILKKRNRNEK